MPNTTTNYDLLKPLVNDATDEDLWGGYLNDSMDLIDTQMKVNADAVAALGGALFPVGSIYVNKTVSTNPATLLGFGTWSALTDRFIIGASGTYAAGTTGGAATHTLTVSEIPSLTYTVTTNNSEVGTAAIRSGGNGAASSASGAISTNAGGGSHSILNPYVSAYMWERTA